MTDHDDHSATTPGNPCAGGRDALGPAGWRRRQLLAGTTLALLGRQAQAQPEPRLETTRIRLVQDLAICFAPQYLAEDLLRAEGFTEVRWVKSPTTAAYMALDADVVDMTMDAIPGLIYGADHGSRLVTLAGIHAGCYELFGNDKVRQVRDLKGKRIGIYAVGGADHVLLSSMLAYVGIRPKTDVEWVLEDTPGGAPRMFAEGKIDAFLGFAPQPQELRRRGIGRVILNTAEDRPWSQYYCCALAANRHFTERHPVATKRALRAILKATDICASDPARAARAVTARDPSLGYELNLEVLESLPYGRWRSANPADTFRFHALRLYEGGLIRSSPEQIIARATDWRHLDALKRELKA